MAQGRLGTLLCGAMLDSSVERRHFNMFEINDFLKKIKVVWVKHSASFRACLALSTEAVRLHSRVACSDQGLESDRT